MLWLHTGYLEFPSLFVATSRAHLGKQWRCQDCDLPLEPLRIQRVDATQSIEHIRKQIALQLDQLVTVRRLT